MAYGSINVPGVSGPELEQVRTLAQNAKDAADAAAEAITRLTSTINSEPSQSGSLTYTGNEQSPAWNSYDPNTLTIGGTTKATNAGTYTATFNPERRIPVERRHQRREKRNMENQPGDRCDPGAERQPHLHGQQPKPGMDGLRHRKAHPRRNHKRHQRRDVQRDIHPES